MLREVLFPFHFHTCSVTTQHKYFGAGCGNKGVSEPRNKNNNMNTFNFFRKNKTKMATIKAPEVFLHHLKDNDIITKEEYEIAQSAERIVYEALEFIEKGGHEKVDKFWKCVDKDHILAKYPQISELLKILKTSQVKKTDVKTRRSQNNNERNQAGPSSQSTNSQNTAESVTRKGLEGILALIKYKKLLPITCGERKALLIRKELSGKKSCIRRRKKLMTPVEFVKLCEKQKWKQSIKCHGKSLNFLIKVRTGITDYVY
ncbi:uncharacterized protein LOC130560967 isoform X2 [Triplophysa rosa]|uniref:uncharacterized protein LOC130560967 isoform X2 n=1 Tax=Triplophysa rosa TaxID=992332 RepID=UPI002545EE07|nr:uncharacterized protein LOC130560967 isoform X2 [Triplophysa rosa]